MIIQCPKCLAKFKLDDSKISDEGTKVRCSKCKEVFVVTKEEPAPPPPPPLPQITPPEDKDEVDFSFGAPTEEKPLFGEEGFNFAEPGTDFSFGEEPVGQEGTEEKSEYDLGGMSYGEVNIPGSDETEPVDSIGLGAEKQESPFGDFEFREEQPEESQEEPAGGASFPEGPPLLPPSATERQLEARSEPVKSIAPQEEAFTERPAPSIEETTFREEFRAEVRREKESSSLKIGMLALFILVIAGAALWYGWLNYKTKEAGEINITDLNGSYAQNAEAGRIFVITGKVVNNTNKARSFFQVRGIFYNNKGEKIAQKEVYCGKMFTSKEISTLPRAKIEDDLKNKVGDGLSNINLSPGKAVPFTIIFFDLPADMAEFSAEVIGSQIASE